MDAGAEQRSSPSSSTSSPPTPTKRPAGRTKFTETRHPVYRGVRQRGGAGRWVCEVRVPGQRGERLWLGTYVTAEEAARAHDAAMLALRGRSAASACLNFADSEWLLVVPPSLSNFADVRRAAVEAVADFQRKQAKDGAAAAFPVDEVTSTVSVPSCADDAAGSSAPPQPSADRTSEVPAALGNDMFELHMSGEMGLGTYYADLAEGLLLDPPPTPATGARSENGDCGDDDGADDAVLWSY